MKTILYYYSATGNSLYVARRLQEELGDVELRSMARALQEGEYTVEAERVGFVFPMHYFGVEEFLGKLVLREAPYLFAVVTCGVPYSPLGAPAGNEGVADMDAAPQDGAGDGPVGEFLPGFAAGALDKDAEVFPLEGQNFADTGTSPQCTGPPSGLFFRCRRWCLPGRDVSFSCFWLSFLSLHSKCQERQGGNVESFGQFDCCPAFWRGIFCILW